MSESRPNHSSRSACILLVLLTGLLAARPLISEVFESADVSFLDDAIAAPTPATSAWLDFLTLVVSIAALAICGAPWQRQRLTLAALVAMLGAIALSTAAAFDKRVALNAASNLLVMTIAGFALARLVHSPRAAAIVLAAMLASISTNAVKCLIQHYDEYDATLTAWLEHKAQLAAAGRDVHDAAIENYERRLRSGNTSGYLAHPNVLGSLLAMGSVAGFGIACALLRRADTPAARGIASAPAALSAAIGVLCAFATALTGSKGALFAAALGVALVLALRKLHQALGSRPARTALLVSAVYGAGLLAMIGYGTLRGTLPGASLSFRWEYWTAAFRAWPEWWLTGVGRENFIVLHQQYKSADATEEVRNPHSLWVSLLVELGPLGLITFAVILVISFRRVIEGLNSTTFNASSDDGSRPTNRSTLLVPGAAAALTLSLQAFFSETPFGAPGIAVVWAIETAAVWCAAFAIFIVAVDRVLARENGACALATTLAGALVCAIAHATIDFALLTAAGVAAYVALVGAAVGAHAPPLSTPLRWPVRIAMVSFGLLLIALHVGNVLSPIVLRETAAQRMKSGLARAKSEEAVERALTFGLLAANVDSLDNSAGLQLARTQLQLGLIQSLPMNKRREWLQRADSTAERAARRCPRDIGMMRTRARICDALAASEALQPALRADAARRAAQYWEGACALYPTSPRDHVSAALACAQAGDFERAPEWAERGLRHLNRTSEIDATRPPENASKLRASEWDEIRALRERLLIMLNPPAVTSAPASTSAPSTDAAPGP